MVDLILDTDMGNDIDDALALAMIHALQSRGECRLLGVAVSKDNPYAPVYVDVVNTFYGRGEIPIGMVRDGVTPEDRTFIRQVSMARCKGHFAHPRTQASDAYPDAVEMLRRVMAGRPDGSITLVMIGFSTNVARVLESGPDVHSPLAGRELLARKVKHVVAMAGNFSEEVQACPTVETREYNIHRDVDSAARFFNACPVPILFSGYEVGSALPFPARSIEEDYGWAPRHPVAEAYRAYMPMPYDRATWDLTAVLAAVRPPAEYFDLSDHGCVTISDDGIARFTAAADGPHRYLRVRPHDAQRLIREFTTLCAQQPCEIHHSRAAECDRCTRAAAAPTAVPAHS